MRKNVAFLLIMASVLALTLVKLGVRANGPDNPLYENVFVYTGQVEIIVNGNGGSSGSIVISLPSPATVIQALLYTNIRSESSIASATINSVVLGELSAYSIDTHAEGKENLFRWNASGVVTGSGTYSISVTPEGSGVVFFHELVVVYTSPLNPSRQIIINDGNEYLVRRNGPPSQSTIFHNVYASNDAKIIFSVWGGDQGVTGTGEFAAFNGIVLESGDPWNGEHGEELDINIYSVTTLLGNNNASVGTEYDFIGWHLTALSLNISLPRVPVGGYAFPIGGHTLAKPLIPYLSLISVVVIGFIVIRRKTTKDAE